MWWQLATLALSFVSLAVGANWISTAAMRRVRGLKAHAELLSVLPEGQGKQLLAKHLDEDLRRHVAELKLAPVKRWGIAAIALLAVTGLMLAVLVFVSMLNLFGPIDAPTELSWIILGVVVVVAGAAITTMNIAERQLDKKAKDLKIELPDDE